MDEIATYERDPANMESRIESVFADADVEAELPQADLDMLDVCFSMASGLVGVFVATNDDVAKWLEKVHDAASGNPGDCGVVQQMLGSLLFHKGDALDVYAPEEGFIARNGERAYVMFHRPPGDRTGLQRGRDSVLRRLLENAGWKGTGRRPNGERQIIRRSNAQRAD